MVSTEYFAAAFQSTSATNGLPSSSYETNRKRKRNPAVSEDDTDGEENGVASNDDEFEALSSIALGRESLSQDAAIQYETSGHPIGKTLPGSSFPHAFRQRPTDSPQPKSNSKFSDELANLRPALCVAAGPASNIENAKSGPVGMRQQHLIALTAVLHKCVLEGDFVRAGRAWGMLLRAEHNGHSLDLRTNDRWGLGAEIILRREAQLVHNKDQSEKTFIPRDLFSPQAFEQAKDYYERLVLQYPYRKAFPNTTGPQDFYFAMFTLWIYSVEKQHPLALAEIQEGAANGERTNARAVDQDDCESVSDRERRQRRQRKAVHKDTLQRANKIAARLGELLMSPPYSDNIRYSQLQGMLNIWIKDLSEAHGASDIDDDDGNTMSERSSISSGLDREQDVSNKLQYGDIE